MSKFIRTSFLVDNIRDQEVVVEVNMTREELNGVYKLVDAYGARVADMFGNNVPHMYFEACEYNDGEFELKKKLDTKKGGIADA